MIFLFISLTNLYFLLVFLLLAIFFVFKSFICGFFFMTVYLLSPSKLVFKSRHLPRKSPQGISFPSFIPLRTLIQRAYKAKLTSWLWLTTHIAWNLKKCVFGRQCFFRKVTNNEEYISFWLFP